MPTIIKEARLIMTDVGENNNKFYYLYLYDDDSIKSVNGRVGVTSVENDGQMTLSICEHPKYIGIHGGSYVNLIDDCDTHKRRVPYVPKISDKCPLIK